MSRVIDEHRRYVRDAVRIGAYERAIREIVRPGDVVVDLASGTGILGLLACRAGARRVYAVEVTPLAHLARELAESNGLTDRITVIRGRAADVSLPELADVALCDQIGWFGVEAGVRALFADARARFLKPGGRLVPATIDLILAPVEASNLFARVAFWSGSPAGFDFGPARRIADNSGYPVRLTGEQLLGDPHRAHSIDLASTGLELIRIKARLTCSRAGTLHGLGGWFNAHLSPTVRMTNSPIAPDPINRRQVYFPIPDTVAVQAGDPVDVAMRLLPEEGQLTWHVTVSCAGADARSFRLSTFNGMLMDPADLRLTDPDCRPALTPRGLARLSVLELCDGQRRLRDIEAGVYERHHDLFTSPAEAAEFVAEVVTRYSTDG
jgi:protein arginine N-methyltransferase 1